jgi:hypothetical protein
VRRLAKFLSFSYAVAMGERPPLDLLNSLVRILRTRDLDHIDYVERVRDVIKGLRQPARPAIWLRVALDDEAAVTAGDIELPD